MTLVTDQPMSREHNLSLQRRLYDLRSETKDAFDEAKRLESRWKELEKAQREVYQVRPQVIHRKELHDMLYKRFTPQFLLLRLRHSVTAQDEASEALVSSFVQQTPTKPSDGNAGASKIGQDIEEFIRDFKESRKIYHKRALWVEKWATGHIIWRDN